MQIVNATKESECCYFCKHNIRKQDERQATAKLRDLIMSLTGVDVLDNAGEFRSVYEILEDIGEVFDDLSSVEQMSLLEALAGKRNSNVLASVLNNVEGIYCECEIDGHYINYISCFGDVCKKWKADAE